MESRALSLPLFGASALATLGYAIISRQVAENKTWDEDLKAREKIVEHSTKDAKKAAQATHHIGKWYTLVPLGLAAGLALASKGKVVAGATVAAVSIAAPTASSVLDRVMKWRKPPPGKPNQENTSYPSGHALETTAVSVATAWILARERIATGWILGPLAAALAAISGLGRLVMDRHWTTDSAAGYCAGIALGCASAGVYEITSPTR
jgi:membrane-associated phospholipid phosphatase